MRIMARFQWLVGVGTEVTNAITPPSPTGGGKTQAQDACLGCAIKSGESCLVGGNCRWDR